MVNEILLNEELDELGIVVSKEELADLLTGDNISPWYVSISPIPKPECSTVKVCSTSCR